MLAAVTDLTGSFPQAIEHASAYLNVRGHAYPSTLEDVRLHGVDRTGGRHSGQATLAVSPHPLEHVSLEPECPAAYEPALDAIRAADVIVIGPGSLYTSLIPNFLVQGVADAVRGAAARRVYVCNVANMRGETCGLDAADHVVALAEHGLEGAVDVVLVHDPALAEPVLCHDGSVEPVAADDIVLARIAALGPQVVTAALADANDPVRHSRDALCHVLGKVVS
jgi:uncharacterized cofD-like protein